MSEKAMWHTLKGAIGDWWDAQRHEDNISEGIPDLSFGCKGVNGWIELKFLKAWPVRATTPVRINHFTSFQRNWLWKRGRHSSCCWLLLKVGKEWLLFSSNDVFQIGKLSRQALYSLAFVAWPTIPNKAVFLEAITTRSVK